MDLLVTVSDRLKWQELETMQERAFSGTIALLPVVVLGDRLQIGPLLRKGSRCCFSCFLGRLLQHSPHAEEIAAMHAYYADHANSAPDGFFPATAALAAGGILERIEKLDAVPDNLVTIIDLFSFEGERHEADGLDRCRLCGTNRSDSQMDLLEYVANMQTRSYPMEPAVESRSLNTNENL